LFKPAILENKVKKDSLSAVTIAEENLNEQSEITLSDVQPLIFIPYTDTYYKVVWHYDRGQNVYWRYHNLEPHFDGDGEQISASNIIVQFVETKIVDDVGRRQMNVIGDGKCLIAIDGVVKNGTWRKADNKSRTRFYDEENKEVIFNPGKIWINVVPEEMVIDY
jgi:hypothetical protein